MTRKNKTRSGITFQKKGTCIASIPYVEADILGDGSVYVELPKRSAITHIYNNVIIPSSTLNARIIIFAKGAAVTTQNQIGTVGVIQTSLVFSNQYSETGGELVIKAGTTPPADGALVGELIVEYVELDRNIGEYTTILDS